MAENKRNRKLNFTAAECPVIFEEGEQNIEIIKSTVISDYFNCLIDFNPLNENQFKLKTYQQVSLAIKIFYHSCDITFLPC